MKTQYTLGFLFNYEKSKVLLIRKKRPIWQYNRLNGVGGHVEKGETSLQCMSREFREEVKYTPFNEPNWAYFAELNGPDFQVDCFSAIGDLDSCETKTSESIEIINVCDINPLRINDMIENLPWLISMAIDFLDDGRPAFAHVTYNEK